MVAFVLKCEVKKSRMRIIVSTGDGRKWKEEL
jgi:hypothetical protein